MKFKLDENVPRRALELFRAGGHDALMVLDQVEAGLSDAQVAGLAAKEDRALVTLDLDFADIRTYDPRAHHGIVILRPRRGDARSVLVLVEGVLAQLDREPLVGRLWIVEPNRLRIRGDAG